MHHGNNTEIAEILSISSASNSPCSDFRGFELRKDVNSRDEGLSAASDTNKNDIACGMDLLPADEIFEVNSNSTSNTLKKQRLARNKELRLKATYLVSRRPTLGRGEYRSESSSEFPASSPSNPQKSQQQSRPPLLKNTLPADAFERGLALIATQNPQLTMIEKIDTWKCTIDDFSDVEDVLNFDERFKDYEERKRRLLPKPKYQLKSKSTIGNNIRDTPGIGCCSSFADFKCRLMSIKACKPSKRDTDQKRNLKLTSEEDEKPTTSSNCVIRNRDTPLKKRTCKYKRAVETNARSPQKKSSSSDTPKDGASSPKKKLQQHKLSAATAAGEEINFNEKVLCPSSSDTSSQVAKHENKNLRNLRSRSQTKTTKIMENNWNNSVPLTASAKKDDNDSFFRWRRLSREIDKMTPKLNSQQTELHNNSKNPSGGLIQIRYDFMESNDCNKVNEITTTNTCNIVVKPLKLEDHFKAPAPAITNEKSKAHLSTKHIKILEKTENSQKEEEQEFPINAIDKQQDSGTAFHQQHEFCNYLGLTGMSTANAMANAAAELSKCKLARRSLRVRHIEQRKAKNSKQLEETKQQREPVIKTNPDIVKTPPTIIDIKHEISSNGKSKSMANSSSIRATSLESEMQSNGACATPLSPSEQWMQKTKEKEAKIQILCQITASSKEEEEEACKKCVEQITAPIRRTLLQQCQQNEALAMSNSNIFRKIPFPADDSETNMNKERIEGGKEGKEGIKIVEIISKTPSKRKSDGIIVKSEPQTELKTLHEKVQKCLEESRQNTPNIFIVQSLDSLKNIEQRQSKNLTLKQNSALKDLTEEFSECKSESGSISILQESVIKVDKNINSDIEIPCSLSKVLVKSHKATQVDSGVSGIKESKRKLRPSIKKSNSNGSGTRRLYTRSMLNLNQQRELRNRKVILKLLKTYSGLKIKVSKPKTKSNEKASKKQNNKSNVPDKNRDKEDDEATIELAVGSQDTIEETNSVKAFFNKLSDSSSTNAVAGSSSNMNVETEDSTINPETTISLKRNETRTLFSNKTLMAESAEDILKRIEKKNADLPPPPNSSATLSPRKIRVSASDTAIDGRKYLDLNRKVEEFMKNEKVNEVAVQTDLCAKTTSHPPAPPADYAVAALERVAVVNFSEMDVSSSDVVTSTTSGDNNRFNQNASTNLVTKELYRNFSFVAESNVVADAAHSNTSSASPLIELNPLANVEINTTNANINRLGIHVISEPSRALRNPLKMTDGRVLHIFYEFDMLIVVQENLVSFWKYMRIINALTVKPRDLTADELQVKAKLMNSCTSQEMPTPDLRSSAATIDFRTSDLEHMSSMLVSGTEWVYLGERKRLCNDIEIKSPYMNRMCFSESRPVYIEMRCRELLNDFRECNLLSCYVNVYYFNEEDQVANCHSIQLDSIQSIPSDVIYTTINESRYFVLSWPQANVLGKVRSGLCKYALTPELNMLATTRDFKAMRHALRSLECLTDGKLVGFGDSQLTVWDHRSGDVLMNYDLSMPLGRNLGTIYYPSLEIGQNNVLLMFQHVRNEVSSDLVVIACTISHTSPSRRILQRHRLPTPLFYNIRSGVNNGEHFVITANTDEEIWISCNDPRQLVFVPAQRTQRFYTRGRTQIVEVTNQTLTVDTFSNYLLKMAAGINEQKIAADKAKNNRNW